MYKTENYRLKGLSNTRIGSLGNVTGDVWDKMVSAYSDKGATPLKNLKGQRLTAEQLDPYFFRGVDLYVKEGSPDDLYQFMDYIWAWSSGFDFSNNDSSKVRNFTDPMKFNFVFKNSNTNTPTYLVWLTFTMNNNGSIDKASNWLNHRTAFSDVNTLAKTPVIATIKVARLSDATPFVITGTKLIDGSSNQYTKHTNTFGEYVSWQSNWEWNTKSKTTAFSIANASDGVNGLIANCQYMQSNCQLLGGNLSAIWNTQKKLHVGLAFIDKVVYDKYAEGTGLCAGIRALSYDCYSYEYLYYKYNANPLKLRDETNTKGFTNKHENPNVTPQIIGIYQMPNGDYYWSADGIFFCEWKEEDPEIIIKGDDVPQSEIKCPSVKCYTETTDKKLYLNRVQLSEDDVPFKVRQKTTKCTPKDTKPTQKYLCEENEIDDKIYRLLTNYGNGQSGVLPAKIGRL